MKVEALSDRYRGALLGVAIGDAFGAPFEGRSRVEAEELSRATTPTVPLRYTDDTHMTIGLARSLIARRGFDGAHLAQTFMNDFNREPWRGYGPGPSRVFAAIRNGLRWETAARMQFNGAGSLGNGAAMRVAPAALLGFPDLDAVAWLAHQSALVTHSHEVGVDGAKLQACAIALLLASSPDVPLDREGYLARLAVYVGTREMRSALDEVARLPVNADPKEVAHRLGNGVEAPRSVPTALYCFLRTPESLVDTLAFALAVGFGGDTDTIASMACALAGAFHGEADIPGPWTERVEGTATLRSLADELFELAARNTDTDSSPSRSPSSGTTTGVVPRRD